MFVVTYFSERRTRGQRKALAKSSNNVVAAARNNTVLRYSCYCARAEMTRRKVLSNAREHNLCVHMIYAIHVATTYKNVLCGNRYDFVGLRACSATTLL